MKNLLVLFFLLPVVQIFAQVTDDFGDGNFSENPTWIGSSDDFVVNAEGQLQLFNEDPSTNNDSYLSTVAMTSMDETTTWEFSVLLDFATSSSNHAWVYLVASNSDLSAPQNGYLVRIGGVSGDQDALQLYRQDGDDLTAILSGTAGAVGGDPAQARVRVTRTPAGLWTLWADYTGGTNYENEGNVVDDTWEVGTFFGVYCNYTSSRAEDMFFDDVVISPTVIDETAPSLVSVLVEDATTIVLTFDELLEDEDLVVGDFAVDNGIGQPTDVVFEAPSTIKLTLGAALQNLTTYAVTANNIKDLAGNIAGAQIETFTYYEIGAPEFNDVVITEIMADPTPVVGLPDTEYIEIYNASDKVLQLSDLKLKADATQKDLPSHTFLPGEYVIICDEDFEDEFAAMGIVAAIASFPALTNGGEELSLVTASEETPINSVTYSDTWYKDADKDDGGWSLELINLAGPYNCDGNWRASDANIGGTPGVLNSVNGTISDISGPRIQKAIPLGNSAVLLTFNEAIDFGSIGVDEFMVTPTLAIDAVFDQGNTTQVLLELGDEIEAGIIYELAISTNVTDCTGNEVLPLTTIRFGLTEDAEAGDILVNEILFNPKSGGSDFVELYNHSDKVINIAGLVLQNTAKTGSSASNTISDDYLIFPQDYIVLTEDAEDILARYEVAKPNHIIEQNIPSFDDDDGNISILSSGVLLDSLRYSDEWHYALLADDDGVSLERISVDLPTQNSGNWHSAASTVGYATPTAQNSQWRAGTNNSNLLNIPYQRFSPDNDGFEDVLQIEYKTAEAGYSINLMIYDANGRQVKQLASNLLLETEGSFRWDGMISQGVKARMGIYIVWAEIFHPDGSVEQFKETVTLVVRL